MDGRGIKPNHRKRDPGCTHFERILSLSDGVFAFAITLLALSLSVPILTGSGGGVELTNKLEDLIPVMTGYVISFLVIAAWWKTHHRIFTYIKGCDRMLISLNFYFLFGITLIPFLTNLIIMYGEIPVATILYAAIQAATGGLLLILWLYVSRKHRLVSPRLSPGMIEYNTKNLIFVIMIFVVSIPIAFLSTTIAQISWVVIAPARVLLQRAYGDIEEFIEEEEEKIEEEIKVEEGR
jgi:uncharacterized membrane protein